LRRIQALLLDVDGVLTDNTFWWGAGGEEFKRFSFADVMALARARRAGLIIALVSGETSILVDRFAKKVGIQEIYQGCKDKAGALRDFAARHRIPLSQISFMGNDVNDLAALGIAGLAVAPADAEPAVLRRATLVTTRAGGYGAVRELIERLLPGVVTAGRPTPAPRKRPKPRRN
jgi:3-deoxy-D-manno-octulosonate 8-phosphate phosphatase (KDO 8-P phosphatase)